MLSLVEQQLFDRSKRPLFSLGNEGSTVRAQAVNASCGDEIEIALTVESAVITRALHHARGCAVSTASADLLCESLIGIPIELAAHFDHQQLLEAIGIQLSPARLKCALLPLEALRKGLNLLPKESPLVD